MVMKKKKQRKEKQYFNTINNKIKTLVRKFNNKDYIELSQLCDLLHIHQEVVLREPLIGRSVDCPSKIKIISFDNNTAHYVYNDKQYNATCASLLVKV